MKNRIAIVLYLSAAVAANLVVAKYGQPALAATAFLLIPFDLFTRDILHEYWHEKNLWPKMTALILAGSLISTLVNLSAWRVALASFFAFMISGFSDALVYQSMVGRSVSCKMNLSNFISGTLDSIAFPMIAFGTASPILCASQSLSKFAGGLLWVSIYVSIKKKL